MIFKLFFTFSVVMVNSVALARTEKSTILPFHNIDGYIMVSGSIDNAKGKFMFDTGTPFTYLLNNNRVDLHKDKYISYGFAGSGQPITIFEQYAPVTINLYYGTSKKMHGNALHADFEFIQKGISSDFLGMIGQPFSNGKPFLIDYRDKVIVFYDSLPIIYDSYIKINVTTSTLPEVTLNIGGEHVIGYFDSGSLGSLVLTKESELNLKKTGKLETKNIKNSNGEPLNGTSATLSGIKYGNVSLKKISNVMFKNGTSNKITLGYSFLKNYISLWDVNEGSIYITPID